MTRVLNKKSLSAILFASLMLIMFWQVRTPFVSALPGPEDTYEDNDYFSQAQPLGGTGIYNLTLGDEDWFYFNVNQNQILNITIIFDGTYCDMDIELYDYNQLLLASSNSSQSIVNATENIEYNVTTAGDFYLRVFTLSVYSNETYLLDVNILTPSVSTDDIYEDNDDFATAAPVPFNFIDNLTQLDPDYYSVYLKYGDRLEIYVNYDETVDNLTLDFYNNNQTFITSGYELSGIADCYINYTATNEGTYYIFINGLNLGVVYSMDLVLTPPPIQDDWCEENDDFDSAYPIANGSYSDLVQLDPDFYSIWLDNNVRIIVDLQFDDSVDNLTIYFLDENRNFIAAGIAFSKNLLELNCSITSNGTYYIHIDGNNYGANYSLNIYTYEETAAIDDDFEENDFMYNAPVISFNTTYTGLVLNDDDFYLVYLNFSEYCEADVEIVFDNYNPNVAAEIYDENGYLIDNFYWSSDVMLSYYGISGITGNYYIRIFLNGSVGPYNYSLSTYPYYCQSCEFDDQFEENDDYFNAFYIQPGHYTNLTLCDMDFYRVTLNPNDTLEVTVNWFDPYVTLSIFLWELSPNNEVLIRNDVQLTTAPGQVKLTFIAPSMGDYVFSVDYLYMNPQNAQTTESANAPTVNYDMDISIIPPNNENITDTNTTTSDSNSTNPDLNNPFGSIPGFPVEIIAPLMMMATFVLVIKKKREI